MEATSNLAGKQTLSHLLHLQSLSSLEQWCDERGLDHTNPIETIIDYYSYLDELCIPSTTVESNLVFSNEEVLYTLTSWCKPYLLNELRLVNKLLSKLIPAANVSRYEFGEDVFSTMCWYYIPFTLTTNCDVIDSAAMVGYELVLGDSSEDVEYTQLMFTIAEYSDCSLKYFNLFTNYYEKERAKEDCSNSVDELEDGDTYLLALLRKLAISGDVKIFKYALSKMFTADTDTSIRVVDLFFYCRLEMINIYSTYTTVSTLSYDVLLSAAYCGGHYEEMLKHTKKKPVEKRRICQSMFEDDILKVVRLDLLTDIIDHWERPDEIELFVYLHDVDYTLEEFKRLWPKVESRFVKRRVSDSIIQLLSAHRLDVIYYLLSLESYPREEVSMECITPYTRTYCRDSKTVIAKIASLL